MQCSRQRANGSSVHPLEEVVAGEKLLTGKMCLVVKDEMCYQSTVFDNTTFKLFHIIQIL